MKDQTGTIRFFNAVTGYGFVRTDTGADLFFHISDSRLVVTEATQGLAVRFTAVSSEKGRRAVDLRVLGEDYSPSTEDSSAARTSASDRAPYEIPESVQRIIDSRVARRPDPPSPPAQKRAPYVIPEAVQRIIEAREARTTPPEPPASKSTRRSASTTGDGVREKVRQHPVFEHAARVAKVCANALLPTINVRSGDLAGWPLVQYMWKEEEKDSPKRGAIPLNFVRNHTAIWLTADGRLYSVSHEEIDTPGWVQLPGYGWHLDMDLRGHDWHPPDLRLIDSVEVVRSTFDFFRTPRGHTWRPRETRTTMNTYPFSMPKGVGPVGWFNVLLRECAGRAAVGAEQRKADAARAKAKHRATAEVARREKQARIDRARQGAKVGRQRDCPHFEDELEAFVARLTGSRTFGTPTIRTFFSTDRMWVHVTCVPSIGRRRWWSIYAGARGRLTVHRHGTGKAPALEAASFLGLSELL